MRRPETKIDLRALVALGAVIAGWFAMATLAVNFGPWQQSIRFYDLWAFIGDPGGYLSASNRLHGLAPLGFGCVCVAALLAPLAPMFYKHKAAWLTYLIPFTVMAVSFAVLYTKTSADTFHADSGAHSVNAYLARVAQGAAARLTGMVATHISIGAGAYIALLASCYLAVRGFGRFRAASAAAAAAAGVSAA